MSGFRLLAVLVFCAVAGGLTGTYVLAGDPAPVMGAEEAAAKARSGQIAILDVRSAAEWRRTGIPAGAKTVTIHDPEGMNGFVSAAKRAVDGDLDAPVALICHSGVRSSRAAEALRGAGFTRIHNIREGMAGNARDGAGWIARGLPLESCARC